MIPAICVWRGQSCCKLGCQLPAGWLRAPPAQLARRRCVQEGLSPSSDLTEHLTQHQLQQRSPCSRRHNTKCCTVPPLCSWGSGRRKRSGQKGHPSAQLTSPALCLQHVSAISSVLHRNSNPDPHPQTRQEERKQLLSAASRLNPLCWFPGFLPTQQRGAVSSRIGRAESKERKRSALCCDLSALQRNGFKVPLQECCSAAKRSHPQQTSGEGAANISSAAELPGGARMRSGCFMQTSKQNAPPDSPSAAGCADFFSPPPPPREQLAPSYLTTSYL